MTGARIFAALFIGVGGWSVYLASASTSASASTLGGTATITDPSNPGVPLASGGSTTIFTVSLPAEAACSGDTANDGYHVFSYLVQQGTTITGITFTSHPSEGIGIVNNTGQYYGPANTAINTGEIISIPTNFEWAPLVTTDGLALSSLLYSGTSGVWEAGLACANSSGTLTDYWNTEVTFTASESDDNGFVWGAVPGTPGSTTTTTTPSTTTTTTQPVTPNATTTTAAAGATTTTPGGATASSGSSGSSGSDGSAGVGGTTAASSGSLAFTGSPVLRDMAIGLLFIGLGFIMLGFSVKVRRESDLWQGALPQ